MNMSNNKLRPAFFRKRAGRRVIILLYTLLILATLPLARTVWDWIGAEWGYVVLLGLYCGAAGFMYSRYRNILILALMVLVSLAIFKIIPLPIERIHFIEYGILGWLVWRASGKGKRGFALSMGYILAISVLDEVIQGILPNRVYDIRDIWMNVTGGCIGLVLGIYE